MLYMCICRMFDVVFMQIYLHKTRYIDAHNTCQDNIKTETLL